MAEYIELEDATAIIEEKQKELCPVGRYGRGYVYGTEREKYDAWEEILDALENLPAADVVPVVHTQWAHIGGDEWCCPVCGFVITTEGSWDKPTQKYCEDCGAKMDGGAD
ncbi:MAG: hypothetical protein ACLVDB_03415 [Anaeromassilibacillus sp.]|jgi:hypothetical protein